MTAMTTTTAATAAGGFVGELIRPDAGIPAQRRRDGAGGPEGDGFCCRVITGDALAVIPGLPGDMRFDVVIADPPYNIGKDFGNNRDAMPLADYVEWTQRWVAHCFDRLSDNGLIYIYGLPEILAHIAVQYP